MVGVWSREATHMAWMMCWQSLVTVCSANLSLISWCSHFKTEEVKSWKIRSRNGSNRTFLLGNLLKNLKYLMSLHTKKIWNEPENLWNWNLIVTSILNEMMCMTKNNTRGFYMTMTAKWGLYGTIMWGADNRTATVAVTVNNVNTIKHIRSTTIAANLQSFVTWRIKDARNIVSSLLLLPF